MSCRSRRVLFLSVWLVLLGPPAAGMAQDAGGDGDGLDHGAARSRFLPSRSSLHVTGGLAGFDLDLYIEGTFGIASGVLDKPPGTPFAKFLRVDAEAINPTDFGPYSFDLEQSLNLTGLLSNWGNFAGCWASVLGVVPICGGSPPFLARNSHGFALRL